MSPKGGGEDDEIDLSEGVIVPDAPTALEISEYDATSANLKWKAGANAEEANVTGYVIEYREAKADEEWSQTDKIKPKKFLTGDVGSLVTGLKYEFRVIAVNRGSKSSPSEATAPQLIKATKAPPKIIRKQFSEGHVDCKVNQQMILEVPVEGAPAPETSWWRDDAEVKSDELVKVMHTSGLAKIMFIPAKRPLRGKYFLKAKNQFGEDTAEIEINVFGKPTIPRGPLMVADVTKKTAHLTWKMPEDDGGRPIQTYEVEKLDPTMDQWLPAGKTKGFSIDIKNLAEGRVYKFLVRAVSTEGDSPDLETEETVVAKDPFDPPTPPQKVTIADWGENFAEVTWGEPVDDGGSDVTGYVVEMRNRNRRGWNKAGATSAEEKTLNITQGIEAGEEYEVRVAAKNKAGESESAKSSNSFAAKARFVRPKIDRDVLGGERELFAGQSLKLVASVVSEPPAKVSFVSPSGAILEASEGVAVKQDEGTTTVTLSGLERKDCGMYKVKAKNSQGEDEAEVRVNVIGPPDKPRGPLEVSDVRSTSCKLMWRKPESDGGSPLVGYTVEKKSVEKNSWVPCASVSGKMAMVAKELECEVKNLIEGGVYMFRVVAENGMGEGAPLEGFAPVAAKPSNPVPDKPSTPRVSAIEKKSVKLEWFVPSDDSAAGIKYYVIEKQETFQVPKVIEEEEEQREDQPAAEEEGSELDAKVSEAMAKFPRPPLKTGPSFSGEFQDYTSSWMVAMMTEDNSNSAKVTDVSEGYKYRFRVKAANGAGLSPPSDPTPEVQCKAKVRPIIDKKVSCLPVSISRGENIVLTAKFSGDPVPERRWYYGKMEIKDGEAHVGITDKDHMSRLTMFNARPDDSGQYEFRVENEFGEETALIDVRVRTEPGRPRGPLRVDDVSASGCKVTWSEPEDDGGVSVQSYVVEKMVSNSGSWMQCGRAEGTEFTITGLTTDKEHRIQVKAVNSEGESEPLQSVDSFITENQFGAPGAAGTPEPIDGDHDRFTLVWDPPKHDGGSKVTGYQVEVRKWKDSVYWMAAEVRMLMERAEVEGLELGAGYAARVRAVNAAGTGPWSLDSEKLVAKHKALKPKFHFPELGDSRELVVREGSKMRLLVQVEGEPPPEEVAFELDGSAVLEDPSAGVTIKQAEYSSELTVESVGRKWSGGLTCAAYNMHGKAAAKLQIKVQGKPSIPMGVLEVRDLRKDGCRLQWEASKSDGGVQMEYVVERFLVGAESDSAKWNRVGQTTNVYFDMGDLEPFREYDFRVKAVNAVGESDCIQVAKTVIAKDKFTVPLPPGPPEITDWSERHMCIQWKEPIDDCGAPVTGYHVEARLNACGDWQLWETVVGQDTKLNVQKLDRGTSYQFRVLALNKAGKSQASHPSRGKEAKAQNLPPSLDTRGVNAAIRAVAGDRVKFCFPYQGEPAPEIRWVREGGAESEEQEVQSDRANAVTLANTADETKLVFNNITKAQQGSYTVTATNATGADTAKVTVTVLDRPTPPEGLIVTAPPEEAAAVGGGEEKKDAMSLLWKRSRDDGGAPIEYYQVERMDREKGSWLACGRSKENTFLARGLIQGHEYRFRVSAVNKYGYSDTHETGESIMIGDAGNKDESVRNM